MRRDITTCSQPSSCLQTHYQHCPNIFTWPYRSTEMKPARSSPGRKRRTRYWCRYPKFRSVQENCFQYQVFFLRSFLHLNNLIFSWIFISLPYSEPIVFTFLMLSCRCLIHKPCRYQAQFWTILPGTSACSKYAGDSNDAVSCPEMLCV